MKTLSNPTHFNATTKVAPISCHCKLSLLVVHLQYLNEKRKPAAVKKLLPALGEAQTLFYQYI